MLLLLKSSNLRLLIGPGYLPRKSVVDPQSEESMPVAHASAPKIYNVRSLLAVD